MRKGREQMIGREMAAFATVRATLEASFKAHKPDAMARTLAALRQAIDQKRRDHDPVWVQLVVDPKIEALQGLVRDHLKTSLYVTDLIGPTAEMAARRSKTDVIVELHAAGHLDDAHVRAAARMAQVVHSVCAASHAKAQNLNRTGRRGDISDRSAFEFHDVYRPWAEAQRHRQAYGERHLDAVLDVAVWRLSVKRTRTRWRLSFDRCVRYVADGLADYARALNVYETFDPAGDKA